MIPEKLIIQGIYSYKNRTEILFESLIESGLFGIFGSVGSGKSTILEAITYALYGETERLNNRDAKAYNMMNLRSDEMEIDFVFRQHTERYRFWAYAKRSSKQFDTITKSERKAYKWDKNQWVPLESTDATHVIGLKYTHFKQIVIIPQGKFNEFIQLSPQQRTDMLKELFPQMERFDFKRPIQALVGEVKNKISTLEGQLHELEEYKDAQVDEIKNETNLKRKQLAEIDVRVEKLTHSMSQLNEIKKLASEIQRIDEFHTSLHRQKATFDSREAALKQYENYVERYRHIFQRLTELETNLAQLVERKNEMHLQRLASKKKLEDAEKQRTEITETHGDIDAHKARVTALDKAIHVVTVQEELVKCKRQLVIDKEAFAKEQTKRNALQIEVENEKHSLRDLKSQLPDEDVMHRLLNNYKDEARILERKEQIQAEIDSNAQLVEKLTRNKIEIVDSIPAEIVPEAAIDMSTNKLVEELNRSLSSLKDQMQHMRKLETTLIEQAGLARYAEILSDSEPCPLCGSEHHPKPFTGTNHKQELERVRVEMHSIDDSFAKVSKAVTQLNMLIETFKTEQGRASQRTAELEKVKSALNENTEERELIPLELPLDQLNSAFKQLKDVKIKISKHEQEIEKKEQQLGDTKIIDALNQALQHNNTHIATLEATISVQLDQIETQWLSKSCSELETMKQSTKLGIKKLEDLTTQIDAERQLLQRIIVGAEAIDKQLVDVSKQKESKSDELLRQLTQDNIADAETVKQVLNSPIDVETERKDIVAFRQELYATQQRLAELKLQLGDKSFDQKQLTVLETQLAQLKESKSEFENTIGALENKLQTLQKKLLVKQQYQSQLESSSKRKENLEVLSTMFRGDGFIRFVSQIYLEQLCSLANDRFKTLTNNQLELEVDEKQQFVVRDFLNEGHTRLLKTLSGGQTFQAAFSLAMALSEQIQQHQHVKQPFFFMDEGFGSLDKESLSLVFDTLKQLRHENRTVGIISHVEELQTEIDRFVHVKNDNETGSSIRMEV